MLNLEKASDKTKPLVAVQHYPSVQGELMKRSIMKKTIAVLEGDGIGPEIVGEGIKVLKAVEQQYGHTFH